MPLALLQGRGTSRRTPCHRLARWLMCTHYLDDETKGIYPWPCRAGEGYEPDAVLLPPAAAGGRRPGAGGEASPSQLKFLRRLAWCPDQCARYG